MDVPVPQPGPGEALLRLRVAGICNTDLEIVRGYMAFHGTMGHEFVADVVQCEEAGWVGRRVCGEINLACGNCERCLQGLGRHCPNRTVLGILGKDGCMAEYLTLPISNLVPVPDGVLDEQAVFCEPLAAAHEILEQLHIEPADSVLVMGDGKLGLLTAMTLAQTGCDLHLLGKHPDKLALARHCGARVWCEPERPDQRFDVVVEATGSASGFAVAVGMTRPRGRLVLKSTYAGGLSNLDTAPLVIDELTLVGSRCGPFAPALRALASARVDPRPLVQHRFPLQDAVQALVQAGQPGTLKVLLQNDS